MVKVADKYIVSKGKEWLKCDRNDLLNLSHDHVYSNSVYDAKQFDTIFDAKRKARKIDGKIWSFNPATGSRTEIICRIPEGAKCGLCRWDTPMNGNCRNPVSEYYREAVSCDDVCEEWEAKA